MRIIRHLLSRFDRLDARLEMVSEYRFLSKSAQGATKTYGVRIVSL
jgi:hypothetical protein